MHGGSCYDGVTPEGFEKYFDELFQKNMIRGNEVVFLNAWNEWGEGMYLEPDKINKFKYLEAIRNVVSKYECVKTIKEKSLSENEINKDADYYKKSLRKKRVSI